MSSTRTFYMIYGVNHELDRSQGPPIRVYTSQPQAVKVAEKLAKDNPGVTFYILQSVEGITAVDIRREPTSTKGNVTAPSVRPLDADYRNVPF